METNSDEFIRGIHGLAKYLGVSVVKAQAIKNSGKLDGCFFQDKKTLLFSRERLERKLFGSNE